MKTYIKPTVKEIELRSHRMMTGSDEIPIGSTTDSFEGGAKEDNENEYLWY